MDVMSNNSSLSCWSSVAYPDPVPTFKWTDNNAMSRTQSIAEYFHKPRFLMSHSSYFKS